MILRLRKDRSRRSVHDRPTDSQHTAKRIPMSTTHTNRNPGLSRELLQEVAHDLRSSITVIQGYAETLLMKGYTLPEEQQRQYLVRLLRNTQVLNDLVDRNIQPDPAALPSGPVLQSITIQHLLRDICQSYELIAGRKGLVLQTEICTERTQVWADANLLRRAINNLIDNAIKFTPKGGDITVYVCSNCAKKLLIRISDTGLGIPPDHLALIGKRHFKSDRAAGHRNAGQGLGLHIVRKILRLHGAELEISSELGKGSSFAFALPVPG